MAFDSDDVGAVGCFGLLRALQVIWTLPPNSFSKVGQAEVRVEKYECETRPNTVRLGRFQGLPASAAMSGFKGGRPQKTSPNQALGTVSEQY